MDEQSTKKRVRNLRTYLHRQQYSTLKVLSVRRVKGHSVFGCLVVAVPTSQYVNLSVEAVKIGQVCSRYFGLRTYFLVIPLYYNGPQSVYTASAYRQYLQSRTESTFHTKILSLFDKCV